MQLNKGIYYVHVLNNSIYVWNSETPLQHVASFPNSFDGMDMALNRVRNLDRERNEAFTNGEMPSPAATEVRDYILANKLTLVPAVKYAREQLHLSLRAAKYWVESFRLILHPIQQQWLADLRSGAYTQTKTCLHDLNTGGFCCLGIAAFVTLKTPMKIDGSSAYADDTAYYLSPDLCARIGLRDCGQSDNGLPTLTTLNDDKGYTFAQIADHVEKHAKHYFTEPTK